MSTRPWMHFFMTCYTNLWVRRVFLTLYYLAIIGGLIYLYGKGDFSTPDFVYQAF